jgi:NCAIR mutase (PurE)-related protein
VNPEQLKELLASVAAGRTDVGAAVERLRALPFESLGYATIDHHRAVRCGHPEVIFCQGKTVDQVVGIARRIAAGGGGVLATRTSAEQREALRREFANAEANELGRAVWVPSPKPETRNPNQARSPNDETGGDGQSAIGNRQSAISPVSVVCAGTSDLPVAEEAAMTLRAMNVTTERITDVGVAGLHRLLAHVPTLQRSCAVVAIAGMEGAMPSVIGGLVDCPVFAVPTSVGYGASLGGLAAMLGMLNSCASNISVVNIDNGFVAAYSAGLVWKQVNAAAGR